MSASPAIRSQFEGRSPADVKAPVRIACKDLNFYYGSFHGLKDINLDFRDRQVTALIDRPLALFVLPQVRLRTDRSARGFDRFQTVAALRGRMKRAQDADDRSRRCAASWRQARSP